MADQKQIPAFDEWKREQEIKITISVETPDETAFESEYTSISDLEESGIRKMEHAVEASLQEKYDYDFKVGKWEEIDDEE